MFPVAPRTAQRHVAQEKGWRLENRDYHLYYTFDERRRPRPSAVGGTTRARSSARACTVIAAAHDFLERVLVARGLCTAPPHRGHRDHCHCISAGAQRPQNPIEHRVEFLSQVLGKIAQDEIAVLLQQLILASIAAVRDGVREMLTAIDFDDDARIRA